MGGAGCLGKQTHWYKEEGIGHTIPTGRGYGRRGKSPSRYDIGGEIVRIRPP